jgi:hypothetical protein
MGYCTACFSGKYPIKPKVERSKSHLEQWGNNGN